MGLSSAVGTEREKNRIGHLGFTIVLNRTKPTIHMHESKTNPSLSVIFESIEIPDSAYDRVESRYDDLGKWLGRSESAVHDYDPEVFPQGSFLLGTVTNPPSEDGEYDLDLGVKLRRGVSKETHTQRELKVMIGNELERYRQARGIQEDLEEKRRCWRLHYQDELNFHLDAVPCIPEDERQRGMIKQAMLRADTPEDLAEEVSNLTVSITDNERDDYDDISQEWNVSNPQGYGRWFASRVRQAKRSVQMAEKRAEVEELPTYKLKAPLQRCVQILKLHRDVMFEDDSDRAPISIIITTLAARAYEGQENVDEALLDVVDTMGEYVNNERPRVPNPVNPGTGSRGEDFADKWYTKEGRELCLEENFWRWLHQAQADFSRMAAMRDADDLGKLAEKSLGLHLETDSLQERMSESTAAGAAAAPTSGSSTSSTKTRIEDPPKPWAKTKG